MALKDDVKKLVAFYKNNQERLAHNKILFDIYEGDLLKYVLLDLQRELSKESFEQVMGRVAPINILKRTIDKLSKIYAKAPKRQMGVLSDPKLQASEKDTNLFDFYKDAYDINTNGAAANEFFNLFKNVAWEPYLDEGKPQLRLIPSDRFLVYSDNQVNPMKPTHFIKVMGKVKDTSKDGKGMEKTILYLYTDTEFLVVDEFEKIRTDIMAVLGNNGVNSYGKIPFVYTCRSRHDLLPKLDTDTLAMSKIIPILLSDLNFAVKFQAFSIIYGIDIDEEDIKMAPNAFWRLKSDSTGSGASKPQIGSIKPQVDIDQVFRLIQGELAFWFNSRGIKPGTIGDIGGQSLASGFSKMIDEMDTSEDRQKQVPFFVTAEQQLWDLTINNLHPVWMNQKNFKNKVQFSKGIKVTTEFAEQLPLLDESTIIDNETKKLAVALSTRKMSLKRLYPDFSETEIDNLIKEIDAENAVITPSPNPLVANETTIPNANVTAGAPGTSGAATPDSALPGGALIDVATAATSSGTFQGPPGS